MRIFVTGGSGFVGGAAAKHFAAQGMVPMKLTPEQFARYIETQTQQTRKVVALSGVKVE